jgi:hypothetical protein
MYILPVEPSSNDWENNEEFEIKKKRKEIRTNFVK